MNNDTDAFARLQRLRAQGVLTDAEYEQQKAALMGRSEPGAARWEERRTLGREIGGGMWGSTRWWLLGSVFVILLIGAYFFGKAASLAESRSEIAGASESGGDTSAESASFFDAESVWDVQSVTDAMTDATVTQATATFKGNQFDIEVGISCSSNGDTRYTAASFDKAGQPAEMRSRVVTFGAPYDVGTWVDYQVRADDGPAVSGVVRNPEYNNQISLHSGGVHFLGGQLVEDTTHRIAAASNVVLRLFMLNGEETIEWDQSDPDLRNLLAPCLAQRQAEIDRQMAEQAEAQRKEAAERAQAPVESVNAM